MSVFQPPPTWTNPILVDDTTGKGTFSPVWLKWFVELAAMMDSTGARSGPVGGNFSAQNEQFAAGTEVVESAAPADSNLPITITGSRGDNEALASLLTQLASVGLITDNTT